MNEQEKIRKDYLESTKDRNNIMRLYGEWRFFHPEGTWEQFKQARRLLCNTTSERSFNILH